MGLPVSLWDCSLIDAANWGVVASATSAEANEESNEERKEGRTQCGHYDGSTAHAGLVTGLH